MATTKTETKETEEVIQTCPNCGGTGQAWDYIYRLHDYVMDVCATCQGHGRIAFMPDLETGVATEAGPCPENV